MTLSQMALSQVTIYHLAEHEEMKFTKKTSPMVPHNETDFDNSSPEMGVY